MSWIFYTLAATVLQTFRNLEQKNLSKNLDFLTVAWSRFILPLPLSLVVIVMSFSAIDWWFVNYCLLVAFFQVAGNVFLLKTFKSKNFSIGVAFCKTEVLQAMVVGFLFFSQSISYAGFVAIMIASIGVMLMSGIALGGGMSGFVESLQSKAVLYGITSGFCYAISAFNLKFASLQIAFSGYGDVAIGVIVLMWVICFQNIAFTTIKLYQNRLVSDLKKLVSLDNKYVFFKTAILSFMGSICWFTAFGIGNVIYVKALAQLELALVLLVSHFMLHERHSRKEMIGIALTSCGIVMLIFFH